MNTPQMDRSESFDSIPEVDFIKMMIKDEIETVNKSLISEFKMLEMSGKLAPEPLLTADKARFVLFPIKHADVRLLLLNNYIVPGFRLIEYVFVFVMPDLGNV
jgi:hypothetical protein